ncbi:uncharacterized protein NDAI_0J03070 [Naumovozyma dairenensis CBS 421]|uniref:Uncharacterized protein n=1 Tax=Naumovozyma dairenensis (strain ATCC 10597 / BCRC 20456 / CBS 421 / NBRC 0211 / NRRL Y-12639) TaxID=1071378 RepID=G0WHC1_NAUDC|nr:hypothetical protein NDAI_0J03070 [Naumovozyma dairenensis CBS 421]CCD27199.1 hypothetical protein NDAI_0J03070 [Naumovozyma dairenensis CBS 421]
MAMKFHNPTSNDNSTSGIQETDNSQNEANSTAPTTRIKKPWEINAMKWPAPNHRIEAALHWTDINTTNYKRYKDLDFTYFSKVNYINAMVEANATYIERWISDRPYTLGPKFPTWYYSFYEEMRELGLTYMLDHNAKDEIVTSEGREQFFNAEDKFIRDNILVKIFPKKRPMTNQSSYEYWQDLKRTYVPANCSRIATSTFNNFKLTKTTQGMDIRSWITETNALREISIKTQVYQ